MNRDVLTQYIHSAVRTISRETGVDEGDIQRYCRINLLYHISLAKNDIHRALYDILLSPRHFPEVTYSDFMGTDHSRVRKYVSSASFAKFEDDDVRVIYLVILLKILSDISFQETYVSKYGYITNQADRMALSLYRNSRGERACIETLMTIGIQDYIWHHVPKNSTIGSETLTFYNIRRIVRGILLLHELDTETLGDLEYS